MKYVVLVSHGTLAQGIQSVLKMLMGSTDDILACSLQDGMSADEFCEAFKQTTEQLTAQDQVILLGDVRGGSPLTNAANILQEKGILANSIVLAGVNLPMALTAAMAKDSEDLHKLAERLLEEAREGVSLLDFSSSSQDDDEI